MTEFNKQLLINIANNAITLDTEYTNNKDTLTKAKNIFFSIKKMEKNAEGYENCKMTSEQFFAEADLSKIFYIEYEEYKNWTKNKLYNEHMSRTVNALYQLVEQGEF